MVRKFFRKKSKRVSTRTRTKIERKVKEHNRKVKKDARKNPFRRKHKEGFVPNNAPFKDDVLKEAEKRKERLEEEREKQKERRKKDRERAKNKKRSLDSMVKDAFIRGQEFDRKNEFIAEQSKNFSTGKGVELSLKQYYKEFKKVVEAADVVIQVLDARDPLGSRCPQVEEAVLNAGSNKRLVLLLNKVDLVPRENVEHWLKHLRSEYPTIAFKASTQSQTDNLSRSKVPLTLASDDLRKSSRCLGAELLLKLLGNYCRNKDIRTTISVGIVGFPNTGKSSIINSLKRSKACSVGATPGVTKNMQMVQLDKHIKLLDSPGIVMASGNDASTILKNAVRVEAIDDPVPAVDAVLRRCTKQKMMMQYCVADFADVHEFLSLLAVKQGRLKKGGLPDVTRVARSVLQDWNQGRITYYTHPPETSTQTHLSATIVTEMSKEFDIASLVKEEQETLKGLKQASSSDMVVESLGPTQAVTGSEDEEDEMESEDEDEDSDEDQDSDGEEDKEDMEEEVQEPEPKPAKKVKFTVEVEKTTKSRKSSTSSTVQKKAPKASSSLDGNQKLNKARKQDFKKMKKQRRRNDAVAGDLADAFEGAFDKLDAMDDDKYDFGQDYK